MDDLKYLQSTITEKSTLPEIVNAFEVICKNLDADDMILFETGTFSFTGERLFWFSLVKQIPNEDDDEFTQIHVDVMYKPSRENEAFSDTVWNVYVKEDFFEFIRNSAAFKYAESDEIAGIDIYESDT